VNIEENNFMYTPLILECWVCNAEAEVFEPEFAQSMRTLQTEPQFAVCPMCLAKYNYNGHLFAIKHKQLSIDNKRYIYNPIHWVYPTTNSDKPTKEDTTPPHNTCLATLKPSSSKPKHISPKKQTITYYSSYFNRRFNDVLDTLKSFCVEEDADGYEEK
jgi:hypothetical protein